MRTPVLIVNFKAYQSATGKKALELARAAEDVSRSAGVSIAVAVQPSDIFRISQGVSIPVLAQHVDPVGFGSNTGHILPEAVRDSGAVGTLVNHSERRVGMGQVESIIRRCREAGLVTVVCAESIEEAGKIKGFSPDFIAFEDPELIGTGKSVSRLKADNVRKFSSLLEGSNSKPLCGAGVASAEDVRAAIELGTDGVLLASAVTRADNPTQVMKDVAKGL